MFWEYLVYRWTGTHPGYEDEIAFQLNDLGLGGYELVSVHRGRSEDELLMFLKRPRSEGHR